MLRKPRLFSRVVCKCVEASSFEAVLKHTIVMAKKKQCCAYYFLVMCMGRVEIIVSLQGTPVNKMM